jgi:exonuclease III
MKLFVSILLVLSFYVHAVSQESTLKVMTYNIWNGYDWGKDKERRSRVNTWIKDQNPSIVALQELCKYSTEKLAEDAASWGREHSILLKTTGYSVGLTSKHPIAVKEKIMENMHQGALHCQTNDIDVFVIHFHPGDYMRRREEVAIILDRLEKVRAGNDKYIVLGDFNSQSPMDADMYDPLLSKIRERSDSERVQKMLFVNNFDYAVMSSFLAFPLIDVCQSFTHGILERGSFPGQVLGKINNETKEELISRLVRIDYIMVSPELAEKCIGAKVCNGEQNYYLSDHYPVIAEFDY